MHLLYMVTYSCSFIHFKMYRHVSRDVDYDEMAWELEKCLTYHFIAQSSGKSQMVMNEEATMARRGLGKFFKYAMKNFNK